MVGHPRQVPHQGRASVQDLCPDVPLIKFSHPQAEVLEVHTHLQRQSLITHGTCLAVVLSCITIPGLVYGLAIVYEPVGRCFVSGLTLQSRYFFVYGQTRARQGVDHGPAKVSTMVHQKLFSLSVSSMLSTYCQESPLHLSLLHVTPVHRMFVAFAFARICRSAFQNLLVF